MSATGSTRPSRPRPDRRRMSAPPPSTIADLMPGNVTQEQIVQMLKQTSGN